MEVKRIVQREYCTVDIRAPSVGLLYLGLYSHTACGIVPLAHYIGIAEHGLIVADALNVQSRSAQMRLLAEKI